MSKSPFGYWDVQGKNGLKGVEGTYTEDLSVPGRYIYHPDPNNPAVLPDTFILFALSTSHVARAGFNRLYPSLLQEEKDRLDAILDANPNIKKSVFTDSNVISDRIQRHAVRSTPVYTVGKRGGLA